MSNTLRMSQLSQLDVNSVLELPVEQLYALQMEIDAAADAVKNANAWLSNYLDIRFGQKANDLRAKAGKQTGIQRVTQDGFDIVADQKVKTEWNQALLREAAETIKSWGSDVDDYITTELKVSETKYKAWEKRIKSVFDPARTVIPGKQSFEIVPAKAAKKAA